MGATYFFTGFPGFIATSIIRHLLEKESESEFELLVHPSQLAKAKEEVQKLVSSGHGKQEQFRIHEGDITKKDLGLEPSIEEGLRSRIDYLFHLAAIYDLAVPQELAYQVNVVGTSNVNEWVLRLPQLKRYVYFSTAYVSGRRKGAIYERELTHHEGFKNFYESTKYEAEKLVQEIMDKAPTTIIRPGITLGHSQTGETVKFDGPYFVMRFLDKFAKFPIPYIGRGEAYINLVPIDYIVSATCYLAHQDIGLHKVYHLTDPKPYKAREAFEMICKALIGKKPSFTLPANLMYASLSIPSFRRWVGVEKETIEYFRLEAVYDSTQAEADLHGSGIHCPDFADYVQKAIRFYQEHRNDVDKRILVR